MLLLNDGLHDGGDVFGGEAEFFEQDACGSRRAEIFHGDGCAVKPDIFLPTEVACRLDCHARANRFGQD